jgi:hypothetical protein
MNRIEEAIYRFRCSYMRKGSLYIFIEDVSLKNDDDLKKIISGYRQEYGPDVKITYKIRGG